MQPRTKSAMRLSGEVLTKQGVPRRYKVFALVVTIVWWLSPLDDMVLPTLLLDEAVLSVFTGWLYTSNADRWYGRQQEAGR